MEVTDIHGKNVLHEAAQACFPSMVDYVIYQGARVDSLKNGDWTPLMLACTKIGVPAYETIRALIWNGANVHLVNKDGWTPLHLAVREGDIDVITLLLSEQADVSAVTKNGRTMLHIAAIHSQIKAVQLLLYRYYMPVDSRDACGYTPLHDAGIGGCLEIARMLKAKGADTNAVDLMGLSSLHLAAQSGHNRLVRYFVEECGMDVNIKASGTGVTPLDCATRAGKMATKTLLLQLGADPNLTSRDEHPVAGAAPWGPAVEEEEKRQLYEEIRDLFIR